MKLEFRKKTLNSKLLGNGKHYHRKGQSRLSANILCARIIKIKSMACIGWDDIPSLFRNKIKPMV